MKVLLFVFIIQIQLGVLFAQPARPVNGPANPLPECYAITHATIYTDYKTRLENVTLVIRKMQIEKVGKSIPIPLDARVIDAKGKVIYPAFIDLYSDYGLKPKAEKPDGQARNPENVKDGAYSWNEAIKAETNAAAIFNLQPKQARHLSECGFGAVVTGLQDGICRGSSALVLTSDGDEEHLIMQRKVASGFSFNKGTSAQSYPSSLAGAVALLRQTYYDAQWYTRQTKSVNLTLEAFNQLQSLPAIFAVNNKLDIFRAAKIAQEFNVQYIIKGIGDEYQRAAQLKIPAISGYIIPLNFPKPYHVGNVYDASSLTTTDLKHWEMAPANPYLLYKSGVEFAITSSGCESSKIFIQNLRKAVQYGLPPEIALKSLTITPAKWIHAEHQIGTIAAGKLANFIVTSGDLFDEETRILECWSGGKPTLTDKEEVVYPFGEFECKDLPGISKLQITGNQKKSNLTLFGNDTLKGAMTLKNGMYSSSPRAKGQPVFVMLWSIDKADSTNPYRFEGSYTDSTGKLIYFSAIRLKSFNAEPFKKDSMIKELYGEITFPFNDYGRNQIPKQESVVIRNATIWTNEADSILTETDILLEHGIITKLGKDIVVQGAREIDGKGKFVTSGIIDEHSHIALTRGVNEGTQAVTSEVRMSDAVNSEDINIYRQLAGGVTASQLLHGSANPIGGQSAMIKLRWGMLPDEMILHQADGFIKFALGENVKQSNWGDRATFRYPQTRMGVEQVMLDAFTRAKEYENSKAGHVDLELQALVEVLNKKRFITCHSYVQSEINMLMHLADSFNFRVNTFTHILEGYKVADKMKKHGVGASTFADWWAYKMEVMEAIPYNAAILSKMGIVTAINSDDAEMGRRLNQEAAKTIRYGGVSEMDAWKMVTLNPAKLLHLDHRMGSIRVGKDADIVVWTDQPLSVYAKVAYTFVDGRCMYDAAEDELMRKKIAEERNRIVRKLIALKEKGEKTDKRRSVIPEEYTCETINDEGK